MRKACADEGIAFSQQYQEQTNESDFGCLYGKVKKDPRAIWDLSLNDSDAFATRLSCGEPPEYSVEEVANTSLEYVRKMLTQGDKDR